MKIYLQNPEKTQVAVFDNENQIGAGFINWIKLTQDEITQYLLKEAKNNKQKELDAYYSNNECWTFKVFTNDANPTAKGIYASLTRDADFFAKVIPASLGKTMIILDDKNQPIQYFLDATKGQNLNYKINNQNGTAIRYKKIELANEILLANDITSVNNINIVNELQNAVLREINLDTI
jgi:hypothetical protein